jgi:hypothetical protein
VTQLASKRQSAADVIRMRKGTMRRVPVRGVAAIEAFLVERGMQVQAIDGKLLVASTQMGIGLLGMLRIFEPLLVGRLTGKPVACAFPHRDPVEAFTLAVPALPVCEAHLRGADR